MSGGSFESRVFCLTARVTEWYQTLLLAHLFWCCRRYFTHVDYMRLDNARVKWSSQYNITSFGAANMLLLCRCKADTKHARDERGEYQEGEQVHSVLFLHMLRLS